jgi:hypothetical protein
LEDVQGPGCGYDLGLALQVIEKDEPDAFLEGEGVYIFASLQVQVGFSPHMVGKKRTAICTWLVETTVKISQKARIENTTSGDRSENSVVLPGTTALVQAKDTMLWSKTMNIMMLW